MKTLLHMCCGPCSIYPLQTLRKAGHTLTGFFFNHNIHPYQEYLKRLDNVKIMAEQSDLALLINDSYDLEGFLANVAHDPASRCNYCYASRLNECAREAAKQGFEAFTTSLLYSRYQRHDEIIKAGQNAAEEFGVEFLYTDFRPGWQEGIKKSKEMQLYRQQYCGCIYSEKERYLGSKN